MTDTSKMPTDLAKMVEQAITGHPGYPDFAAWCESQLIHPFPIYFMIWQASRAAVVVELPKPDDSFDNHEYLIDRELTVKAIDACGLKVKP
ncbi:hypothetical protein ABXV19_08845 [Pseudomonas alkylphenolica]|uniref:Uncharacterized protein n=1 Tax=Pseudomonas putida TaxID=303 RepID=A0A6S5TNG9_PSEPU|nr:hypothetical protein [Pseudomonas putida]BBT41027.1 hypothetical protein WP8W18C01_33680 [Pseudomonas putida]